MADKPKEREEELHQETRGEKHQLRNDLLRKVYRKLHEKMIKRCDLSSAIDWLFQQEVISEDEYLDLQSYPKRKEQARQLMGILHKSNHSDAFVEMTAALRKEKDTDWIVVEIMQTYNKLIVAESTLLASMDSLTLERSDRCFYIVSRMGDKNRKVLDVRGNRKKPGTEVITYARKSPPALNQLWYEDENGIIRSKLNHFALDNSSKDGLIQLQPFVNKPDQRWIFDQDQIKNQSIESQVLEVRVKSSYSKYANIVASAYHGGCNQLWYFDMV